MATYHCSMSPVARSSGRSVVAAMAYRSGTLMYDNRTGVTHDYLRKKGIINTLLIFPGGRDNTVNRAEFWNGIEKHHKRGDAVLGREIECSLPLELTPQQCERLAFSYAQELADRYGAAADVCLHAPRNLSKRDFERDPDIFFVEEPNGQKHNGNRHAHFMLTACYVSPDGVLGKKVAELDPIHCARHKIQNAAEFERARWAFLVNEALKEAGHDVRVDHRSLEEQGITDRVAQAHRGPAVSAMTRRGAQTDHQDREAARQWNAAKTAAEQAQSVIDDLNNQIAELMAQAASEAEQEALQREQEHEQAIKLSEQAFMARCGWDVDDDHHDDGADTPESLSERALRLRVEADRLLAVVCEYRKRPQKPDIQELKDNHKVKIEMLSGDIKSFIISDINSMLENEESNLSNQLYLHSEKGLVGKLFESKELKEARQKHHEINDLLNQVTGIVNSDKVEKIINNKYNELAEKYNQEAHEYNAWVDESSKYGEADRLAMEAEREARLEQERLHPELALEVDNDHGMSL